MKLLGTAMLVLLLQLPGGTQAKKTVSDDVAYRQLFLLLTPNGDPGDAEGIQALCDYQLGLTQPEKQEVIGLAKLFALTEQGLVDKIVKPDTPANEKADATAYRGKLGFYLASQFSNKEKLDKALEWVKTSTVEEGQ